MLLKFNHGEQRRFGPQYDILSGERKVVIADATCCLNMTGIPKSTDLNAVDASLKARPIARILGEDVWPVQCCAFSSSQKAGISEAAHEVIGGILVYVAKIQSDRL